MVPGPLPYRGMFGAARPSGLSRLPLPPAPMPARHGSRPLKAWRYVGVYGPELMLCLATVRVGPGRQAFWAVWDRAAQRLRERTVTGRGPMRLGRGTAMLDDGAVRIGLALEETDGVETVCASGAAYAWTRKQGGIRAHGTVRIDGAVRAIDALAVIDDTAGYYQRHTSWRWCAGVGRARDGRAVAWNLVDGVNDPPASSERTVWIDGEPVEAPPSVFGPGLAGVNDLIFRAEAERRHSQNLLLVRSSYRQPFGTFAGTLPGDVELAEGYGVMEEHDVRW
jgi:hypothetical protein